MSSATNLVGLTFGKWQAIERLPLNEKKRRFYVCRCECGVIRPVEASSLVAGKSKSCGCAEIQRGTHGMSKTRAYIAWGNMLARCSNPRHPEFYNYGARGIDVCKEWLEFATFFADMGHPPADKSLDRKNNNLGYSKDNCRWASAYEQSRNKRRNKLLTYDGITLCATDWAARVGLPIGVLYKRLNAGWPISDVISKPLRIKRMKR